jgi:hypothetical protein
MYSEDLEPAVNDYSCALACLVSLCRSYGKFYTQENLIQQHLSQYNDWAERPGSMSLERLVNFSIALLNTKTHIITTSKSEALKYWSKSEGVGGLIITSLQPTFKGKQSSGSHAWRLLYFDKNNMVLMNPMRPHAQIETMIWEDFMPKWKACALLLEGMFSEINSTKEFYY